MPQIQLGAIDYAIMVVYFVFVLGIGLALKRAMRTSTGLLPRRDARSPPGSPAWRSSRRNLGAQEVIGMAASGAKYGIATSHFYWVGRDPGDGVRRACS